MAFQTIALGEDVNNGTGASPRVARRRPAMSSRHETLITLNANDLGVSEATLHRLAKRVDVQDCVRPSRAGTAELRELRRTVDR